MVQQHRIYVVQFDKGEPDQEELSCKASPPKGGGRRIMYYYHDYGTGGGAGKNGKPAKSRALSLSGFFGLLLICLFGLATLLAAPGAFFSFARTGGAAGGALRMHSASASFQLVSSAGRPAEEERIRPYTRKWEAHVMKTIDEVRFRRVPPGEAARCDVRHDMPAVLLSTGGFTGNVYHEFNDGLLPMFVTAGHLQRRVVLVILEYHDWWMTKYGDVVSRLSAFPPIDFTADRRVHCFPEVIAGLRIHGELPVDPARPPEGRSIRDFRRLLDDAYRPRINYLERMERKAARKQRRASGAAATKLALPNKHPAAPAERPKLVIVSRTGSRVIENEEELKAVAADVGFDVRVVRPERSTEMCKIYRDLNASDAMVGVHGAAMTHFLFMRPGKVFIQVVPLGTDWAANEYYGEPAARLGLRYVGYKILPEESSLAREYPAGHPVLTDPAGVAQRGWDVTKKVYLDRQNVRLDLARFREELVAAHRYLVAGKRKGRPKTKPLAI
ncbi:xylan glycosyltransferase MUCI21-like [Triticum urartu]|nr:xylan glycosyltransferase MUCI21-like [Triticum urartu]